jgi:DNA-binding NarL/FixJ family response regulator
VSEIRILVADDHEIVRRGLRALLESQRGWKVVAEASTGSQALEKASEVKPEVAVLDVGMPVLNGLEATRRIRQALPQTEVLILTVHDSEQMAREAISCGARGYLVKSDVGRDLIAAVESVVRHKVFLSPRLAQAEGAEFATPSGEVPLARLTTREREIIQLLAEGNGNKDIATRLNISVKTAETHRTNIMRKIGAHSLTDLVRFAIRNRLVEP